MTLVGDVLPEFGFTVTSNSTGLPASPATFVVTLTAPDGTTSTVTTTEATTGVFAAADTVAAMVGQYVARGVATGNGCDGAQVLAWNVETGETVIAVRDAVAHLRARGLLTDTDDLDLLQWLCVVATDAVANDLGRAVVRTVVVEKHSGGLDSLRLRRTPVVSVTSVVESGTTLSPTEGVDWTLDENRRTGLLYRGTGVGCWRWVCGRANITVTYVADMSPKPPVVRSVALGVVEQLWQSSAGVPRSSFDQATIDAAVYATTGTLTAPERAAYDQLRAVGIA